MRQRHHNHHQRRMARWSASLSVAVVWLLSAQIACAGQALDATLTTVPASAPCSSYDSCGACTSAAADGGCGWCSSSQPGHQSGHGSCLPKASGAASCTSPAVWSTTALECSVARCAAVAACDECVAGGGGSCGWCATTGRCLYGSVDGPQPPSGTCPAANDDSSPWRWRTCSHTCAAEQSCVSCTDHSSCGAWWTSNAWWAVSLTHVLGRVVCSGVPLQRWRQGRFCRRDLLADRLGVGRRGLLRPVLRLFGLHVPACVRVRNVATSSRTTHLCGCGLSFVLLCRVVSH